ncbi:histone H1 [uncultured Microscilla sp.]|uniref:histone H1 n=1 Tax=uncultured Microscilla sp. TaxID=432653 RepID=UPI0026141E19|nr:histone H1 [uncultured Microscilla sp.]
MSKNRYNDVQALLDEVKEDFSKFYEKDNQAAGTRVRKKMQDLKVLAQEIRTEVQDIKNKAAETAKK